MILIFPVDLHDRELIKLYLFLQFFNPVAQEVTQSVNQVKIRLISQLIKGISRVLQNLLKFFNCTAISTSFVLPAAGVFSCYSHLGFE